MHKKVDGEDILYHILYKRIIKASDEKDPSIEVKFMIEQLLLWGGVWFKPDTYKQMPVLRPYVIRDSSCRKINPSTGKDSWGHANNKGLMRDDNSSIKGIPSSLLIQSPMFEMNGKTLGKGFVASHVWTKMQTQRGHSCNWERTNSFIPNLVWLPAQLSKLTDREGSYAQQFIQHISYLLYSGVSFTDPQITGIWSQLKNPNITPVCRFDLNDLNFFVHDNKWVNDRRLVLINELQSIINILTGGSPVVKRICSSKYIPTLISVLGTMSYSDTVDLINWIDANLGVLGSVSTIKFPSPKVTMRSAPKSVKRTVSTRTSSPKSLSVPGSYTNKQIANSIRSYLFDGDSFAAIEYKYLGLPKRVGHEGWAAKHLLNSKGVYASMKKMFHGITIADAISMSSDPLKTTLKWMEANL